MGQTTKTTRNLEQKINGTRIVGSHIAPTAYGDGYDTGDILTYDVPNDGCGVAVDPHFALVVSRDGNAVTLLTMPNVSWPTDIRNTRGTCHPADAVVVLPESRRNAFPISEANVWPMPSGHYVTADLADGAPRILGCELTPWDGRDVRYDKTASYGKAA